MKRALCLSSLTLASGKIYFSETFGSGWESRWTTSKWKDSEGTQGKWEPATGKWFKDEAEDTGIQTAEDSKFFGISASFDSFSNAGKDLIIQYQAKYEKDVECGGGYVKIGPKMSDPTTFGDPTVYNIMFGPDKCGYTKRTHLIFNYKGKNVLKKSDLAYKQEGEGTSHLYRMILKPDNTVSVEIDEEQIYDGSIKDDWEVLKPKEIPDPADKKPDDWTDESMIDDPEDKKPDDWVEEKRIVDADAKKPDDWDDEEDGEWEAPMKDNPAYKGDWYGKRISNPAYKGSWEAKKIANPEYEDDDSVYKYEDFGFILPLPFKPKYCEVEELSGGHVFLVRLNRPNNLNSLHLNCHLELDKVWNYFEENDDLWVGVLTGNGRAFCAGNDLKATSGIDSDGDGGTFKDLEGKGMPKSGFGGVTERAAMKPIIAAVNGVAHGGGFEVALSCDVIVASPAADFALPEVRVGLYAAAGGVIKLPRLIGYQNAMEMILTGRRVKGPEAKTMGFVQRLCGEGEDVVKVALALADEIMLGSPDAVQASVDVAKSTHFAWTPLMEAMQQQHKFPTVRRFQKGPNAKEGPLAFSQKRKPNWVSPAKLSKL